MDPHSTCGRLQERKRRVGLDTGTRKAMHADAEPGPMMLRWLRRRQDARRLAQADAEASATMAPQLPQASHK